MRRGIIIVGLILSVFGFLMVFLSGTTFGITIPIIGATNQNIWMIMQAIGFVFIFGGIISKRKKK